MNMPEPLNLGHLSLLVESHGFDREITLNPFAVQHLTARLRGITAIAGILTVALDDNALVLGEWMESSLLDALRSLASDSYADIEMVHNRAENKKGTA